MSAGPARGCLSSQTLSTPGGNVASGSVTRRGQAWRARYRHPELGTEHQRTFPRKAAAQRWLRQELEQGRVRDVGGRHRRVDHLGAVRVVGCPAGVDAQHPRGDVAGGPVDVVRLDAAAHDPDDPRRDLGEVDGGRPPDRPALAPGTIKTRFVNVRSVFRAAVRDRLIGADPTDGVRLPRQRKRAEALSIPSPARWPAASPWPSERFRRVRRGLRAGRTAAR